MSFNNKIILVTGAAGFIGFHLVKALLDSTAETTKIIGFDSINDYYDVTLKEARLKILTEHPNNGRFIFIKGNIADKQAVGELFDTYKPKIVVNLAAQVGVRYSITNPDAYIESNIIGFFNILEAARHLSDNGVAGVEHLVYASSSSVYGLNKKVPYATDDKVDNPVSLYAATKKSNELIAHAYSKLYGIPATGLRFFTVYGSYGRPDMAYYSFTEKLIRGEKIQIFNNGDMYRDFTYIDDVVEGVLNVMQKVPIENADGVKYKLYNIGNNKPENLLDFVETLEKLLISVDLIKKPGEKEFLPMQPGDVYQTYADVNDLRRDFGFKTSTSLAIGLERFVDWYKKYILNKA